MAGRALRNLCNPGSAAVLVHLPPVAGATGGRPTAAAALHSPSVQQRRGQAAAAALRGRAARSAAALSRPAGPRVSQQQQQPPPVAQHDPQQQHGMAYAPVAPVEPSVLESRRWLLQQVPLLQFKAVGVSFDGRQADVARLRRDQGLALVRERDNPHDPHAVAIRTLDGTSLGYIARDKTFHFVQDLCFGAVGSVGQAGTGEPMWGFNVLVQPTIPPVEVLALPASLRPHVSLGMQLQGKPWAALKQAVMAASAGRCAVTAAPLAAVHERWAFDDAAHVLRLLGFRAEAPEVQQVGGLLALQGSAAQGAQELLRDLNCWSDADVAAYLAGGRQLERQRSEAPWRLDLSWLEERGVDVPPALRALGVQL